MAKRVPRTRAGGEWTEARYWGFLRSALRQASRRYPPIVRQALLAVREPCPPELKRGRRKWVYRCEGCKKQKFRDQVEVDHIVPCGTLKSYDDLATFCERLFCEPQGLRVLCRTCHKKRTKEGQ